MRFFAGICKHRAKCAVLFAKLLHTKPKMRNEDQQTLARPVKYVFFFLLFSSNFLLHAVVCPIVTLESRAKCVSSSFHFFFLLNYANIEMLTIHVCLSRPEEELRKLREETNVDSLRQELERERSKRLDLEQKMSEVVKSR